MSKNISVALCTYNGEKYIEKQLNSILNQSQSVNEIIICDDCSSDGTQELLRTIQSQYPDIIHLHFNETNLNSNANFEKAITLTTGDYIFLSDQDDIWMPNKVAQVVALFEKDPKIEGVFTNATFIDDNDQSINQEISLCEFFCLFEGVDNSPNLLNDLLIYNGNYLTGATLCIKKEVKDIAIPFKTGEQFIHDEWLALVLSNRKTLYYCSEKLISYRIHQNQQLGIGLVTNLDKIKKEKRISYDLVLGTKKPKSFKEFKLLTRAYFFQYEKYRNLYHKNNDPIFLDISNKIKEKYTNADKAMKKCNPILYFFRKLKDKKKGKRQL
jgi:glycosyltransferase involved in cell wall biosynthesis